MPLRAYFLRQSINVQAISRFYNHGAGLFFQLERTDSTLNPPVCRRCIHESWGGFPTGEYHHYNRVVEVMDELMKFTYLVRDRTDFLIDRYSERVESAEEVSRRVNQPEL